MRNLVLIGLLALVLAVATGCPENVVTTDDNLPDIDAPDTVMLFAAQAGADGVVLTWTNPEIDEDEEDYIELNKDFEGVLLVRGLDQFPDAFPLRKHEYVVGDALGSGVVVAVLGRNDEEFVDENATAGKTYYYEAVSLDEVPNYSESVRLAASPGSMIRARFAHSQTALDDGRVLLVGGIGYGGPLAGAEIFEPAIDAFQSVEAEMETERFGHTATQLDDGRVLLVGGYETGFAQTLRTAEWFDPIAATFTQLDAELDIGRALHTATRLPDGRVLIAGGTDGVNALTTLEIFDPETLAFTVLDDEMWRARYGHQAAVIGDFVIIFGGFDGESTVPYATSVRLSDLRVASLTNHGYEETPMEIGRLNSTLTPLDDGTWLIAGGFAGPLESGEEVASAELFATAGDPFFALTGSLAQARSGHRAALLPDSTVLVIGGIGPDQNILDAAEIYDPTAAVFTPISPLKAVRTVPEVSILGDGRVLITGGNGSLNVFQPEPASTAEIYDPTTGRFTVVGAL